jgi:hypothetical protein
MSVNIFLGITAQALFECWIPSTAKATGFITGASEPVDIQVGADGSLYYLARGTSSLMKVRYTTDSTPVITTQPPSQLVSVGYPATFSVTASGPSPYSYQWMRNGVNIIGATARSYKTAPTTLSDNGAQFRVQVSNTYGNTLSNVATLSVTSDKPPGGQILTPARGMTYFGVWWLTIRALLLIFKMAICRPPHLLGKWTSTTTPTFIHLLQQQQEVKRVPLPFRIEARRLPMCIIV